MKLVQSCLSSREDRESNFLGCESAVRLVQACLCVGKTL